MTDVRRWLARETRSLHERVDARASETDLAGLLAFLMRGTAAVEHGLECAGASRILPEWPSRRRAARLGAPPPACAHAVVFDTASQVWGGLYVLEGSRIGGRLLARRHATLADHPFFVEGDPFWPTFLRRLSLADGTLNDRAGMLDGARTAFGAYL